MVYVCCDCNIWTEEKREECICGCKDIKDVFNIEIIKSNQKDIGDY